MIDKPNLAKLEVLNNMHVIDIVDHYMKMCKPTKVTVLTDSKEDLAYVRKKALESGEEHKLNIKGHTYAFDGPRDQARDKEHTDILVEPGKDFGKRIRTMDREEGLTEMFRLLDGIMTGKEMFVKFYCLGPTNSEFSICALQITDSPSVIHMQDMLYRQGYEEFKRLNGSEHFFHFVHSAGELEHGVSKNIEQRRVYVDLKAHRVFTINNQYPGNALGLKKLALRLAINKAHHEKWLCEHMFLMGVHSPYQDRITYFTGAYPSACGKTSTAMIPGQTIVGDDIAYIRPHNDRAQAVNIEQGIFGIISNLTKTSDPLIHKALTTPRELIFSNVLVHKGKPYWQDMGEDWPEEGECYFGHWKKGDERDPAHKNARYTMRISELDNIDEHADSPEGVPVKGFIYGGRDSDTSVPVAESLSWNHGVFLGATIESETTAATLGKQGVRKHNPMSILDFLSVPLGRYLADYFTFGEKLKYPPKIFTTNYFLKKDGKYLNEIKDKKIWLLWMEGRVHGEYDGVKTPIGFIPLYEDLRTLFRLVFNEEYTKEQYDEQFTIRVDKYLEKLGRMKEAFDAEKDIPQTFWDEFERQQKRLS